MNHTNELTNIRFSGQTHKISKNNSTAFLTEKIKTLRQQV